MGPELEKQFSKQIGSGGMSNPHISPYKISTDQSASLFWSTVQVHLAVSHCCSYLLTPTLCPAVQPNLFRKSLFFKSGASGYLQNDLFSFKTVNSFLYSYEPRSDRTMFPAQPCCWSWLVTLRCKQTFMKDILEDCFQGNDLAERWVSSLPYLLPNCCLYFICDGWYSCS